jgi:hypothetical protein
MSSPLAVAGVTAVLQGMLGAWLTANDANAALSGANAEVSAVPPDTIDISGPNATPRLNLFLHQASHNGGWRNVDLPSRDASGQRTTNPPLALDLHYLLTAYGPAELQAEVLLGYGMQLMHRMAVLDRSEIESRLPPVLRDSQLGRQVELIKVTPEQMGMEELSRLWSALQAKYRPTAAYHVSVVLIESQEESSSALPVLSRGPVGPNGREQGVVATTSLAPALPTIDSVHIDGDPPGAVLGQGVQLLGHDLNGTGRQVHLESRLLEINRFVGAAPGAQPGLVEFTVPSDPTHLAAGTYALSARVRRPGEAQLRETNTVSFRVLPRMTNLPKIASRDANGTATISIDVEPDVLPYQAVSLILGTREVPAEPFANSTGSVMFVVEDAEPGTYLARIRVGGIDSEIVDRLAKPLTFLNVEVTIT